MIVRAPASVGAGDGGVADAAAAEHGDGVAPLHLAGEHRRAEAGHDPAAEQAGDLGRGRRVDLRALARRPRASSRRRRRCRAPATAAGRRGSSSASR